MSQRQSGPGGYIGPMQQQQPRQTVCWSNAGLPDTRASDPAETGGDIDDASAATSKDASSLHGLGVASAKLRQNLRSSKRRLVQQILVKLNHAKASDDCEYQALRSRQLDLHERIVALATHVKSFATNLVALGHGLSLIGDASVQIAASMGQSMMLMGNSSSGGGGTVSRSSLFANTSCNEGFRNNAGLRARRASGFSGAGAFDSDFPKNMLKLDAHARGLAVRNCVDDGRGLAREEDGRHARAQGALQCAEPCPMSIADRSGALNIRPRRLFSQREMDERENLKLDFDSALRKLRAAKQRGKAEAIVRRDVKLQAARNSLTLATEAIIKKIFYYESARPVLIYHELRQFRELQTRFFTLCASSFQMYEQLNLQDDDDNDNCGGMWKQAALSNQFAG